MCKCCRNYDFKYELVLTIELDFMCVCRVFFLKSNQIRLDLVGYQLGRVYQAH